MSGREFNTVLLHFVEQIVGIDQLLHMVRIVNCLIQPFVVLYAALKDIADFKKAVLQLRNLFQLTISPLNRDASHLIIILFQQISIVFVNRLLFNNQNITTIGAEIGFIEAGHITFIGLLCIKRGQFLFTGNGNLQLGIGLL